jgi:hypothetical protein
MRGSKEARRLEDKRIFSRRVAEKKAGKLKADRS